MKISAIEQTRGSLCSQLYMYVANGQSRHEVEPFVTWMVYVKKNAICKICVARFDKKRAVLLWFASGFVRQARNMVLWCFLPNVYGKSAAIQGSAVHMEGYTVRRLISAVVACLLHSF